MCKCYHARPSIGCPRTRRRTALFFFLSSIYLNSIRTLKFRLNSGLPSPDGVNEMEFRGHFNANWVWSIRGRSLLDLSRSRYLVICLRRTPATDPRTKGRNRSSFRVALSILSPFFCVCWFVCVFLLCRVLRLYQVKVYSVSIVQRNESVSTLGCSWILPKHSFLGVCVPKVPR